MMDNQDKKRPGIVKRNQVADQCNRLSGSANAGAFPRMNIKPTPWCAPRQDGESEQTSDSVDAPEYASKRPA